MPSRRKMKPEPKTAPAIRSQRLRNPADPWWIHDIHSYCHRWCDRCEFSHRCFRYTTEGARWKSKDGEMPVFSAFEALTKMFATARPALNEILHTLAVPGDERSVTAAIAREKRIQRRGLARGARLIKRARTYITLVEEWWNNNIWDAIDYVHRMAINSAHPGGVPEVEVKGHFVRMQEAIETIRWHRHIPYLKLPRAFISREEEDVTRDRSRYRDSDGSAKVALISIDESIAAWAQLGDTVPGATDTFLEIPAFLIRLRRSIEQAFPRARAFRRPGFDEKQPRRK